MVSQNTNVLKKSQTPMTINTIVKKKQKTPITHRVSFVKDHNYIPTYSDTPMIKNIDSGSCQNPL